MSYHVAHSVARGVGYTLGHDATRAAEHGDPGAILMLVMGMLLLVLSVLARRRGR